MNHSGEGLGGKGGGGIAVKGGLGLRGLGATLVVAGDSISEMYFDAGSSPS